MSPRFLLPCQCGKSTPIETSQAGQTITCDCGASLSVPTMREIRRLAPADQSAGEPVARAAVQRRWSPLQGGLFAVGSVVAVLAVCAALLGLVRRSYIDTTDYHPEIEQLQDTAFKNLPIDQSWDLWQTIKQQGLGVQHVPGHIFAQRYYDQHTRMVMISAAIAAVGGAMVAAALLMRPPRRAT